MEMIAAVLTLLLLLPQDKLKPQYLEQLPGQLKQFSLFLGKYSWFAGEKVEEREGRGSFAASAYSLRGRKESDMTERLSLSPNFHFQL